MTGFLMYAAGALLCSSLVLAIAVLGMSGVLRALRVRSPTLHRVGFLAALLVGWTWVLALAGLPGVPVHLPWPFLVRTLQTTGPVAPADPGASQMSKDHERSLTFIESRKDDAPASLIPSEKAVTAKEVQPPVAFGAQGGLAAGAPEPQTAIPMLWPPTSPMPSEQSAAPDDLRAPALTGPTGSHAASGAVVVPPAERSAMAGNAPPEGLAHSGPAARPGVSEPMVTWLVAALVSIWLGGVLATIARWLWAYIGVARRCQRAPAAPEDVCRMWNEMLARHGARRRMPVVLDAEFGPALVRLWRTHMLVLPAQGWGRLSPSEQRAVLLHELAHWLRGDLWKSLAVGVLALPHWFNPLAWAAVRRFDAAAEWACDQCAVCESLEARRSFVRAILALKSGPVPSGWPSTASGSGDVLERVRRLAPGFSQGDPVMKRLVFFVAVVLMLGAWVLRPARPGPAGGALAAPPFERRPGVESAASPRAPQTRALAMAGEPDHSSAPNPKAGAAEAKPGDQPAAQLRYQGYTFQQWVAKGQDLSLAVRCDVAKALAAFGANGMPHEAAAAILDLVAGVKTWDKNWDSGQPATKLAVQVRVSLGGPLGNGADASYVIPVSATMPVLLRYLRQGTQGQQYLVAEVLAVASGVDTTPAIAQFRELLEKYREKARHYDTSPRVLPMTGVALPGEFEAAMCEILRQAMLNADSSGQAAVDFLEHIRKTGRMDAFCHEVEQFYFATGGAFLLGNQDADQPKVKRLRSYLLDLAKRPAPSESAAGIQGLSGLGVHLWPAIPALIELFPSLDEGRQTHLFATLERFAVLSGRALGKAPPAPQPPGFFGGIRGGFLTGAMHPIYAEHSFNMPQLTVHPETGRSLAEARAQVRRFAEDLTARSSDPAIRQRAAKLAGLLRD